MTSEEILKDRERIKDIISRKTEATIKYREEHIKHRDRINRSDFQRLADDIIFLIDNPDYVRIKDRISGANLSPSVTSS